MIIDIMQIKVEKNIPVPKSLLMERIASMEKGDSVFFKNPNLARSLSTRIRQLGFKSTYKKVAGGFRVWKLS